MSYLHGAIIGDIAGSRFEFNNIKTKDGWALMHPYCRATDDTVMTCAIAKAIMSSAPDFSNLSEQAVEWMQKIGRQYPKCGYGRRFKSWMFSYDPKPYNSCGNGAAMRVSACGYAGEELADAIVMAREVTKVTHNHPEGIKAAEATAACIWMARHDFAGADILRYIQTNYYPIDFTLDRIRESYRHTELAQDSVPQAIVAFLESTGYEDCIRNAVSIGGDSDTIAAIAGSIAWAYYGEDRDLAQFADIYLDDTLREIVYDFDDFINGKEHPANDR